MFYILSTFIILFITEDNIGSHMIVASTRRLDSNVKNLMAAGL